MLNRVVHHLGGRAPYVVHRLDSPTSGLLVFAKTRFAAASLALQFRQRLLSKQYLAVLCGEPPAATFHVDAPIARHPTISTLSIIVPRVSGDATRNDLDGGDDATHGDRLNDDDDEASLLPNLDLDADGSGRESITGAESLTNFEAVLTGGGATLCRVRPVTGRMHQIRVHADHLGLPLAGDSQYGSARQPSPQLSRLLLHAHTLEVEHPTSQRRIRFASPLPPDFIEAMVSLGFEPAAAAEAASSLTPQPVEWLGEPRVGPAIQNKKRRTKQQTKGSREGLPPLP